MISLRQRRAVGGLVFLAGSPLLPAQDAPGPGATWPVHGEATFQLRARGTDDERDVDAITLLALDAGDAREDRFTVEFLGRLAADLDGDDGDTFADITDTYSSAVTAQVYTAALSVHRVAGLERLRLGRQTLVDTPVVALFDGAWLETPEWGDLAVRASAYAGVPSHLHESSPEGDRVGGAVLEARPWTGSRWRLDWMHARDEYAGQVEEDDLWSLRAWQAVAERGELQAGATLRDGDLRDVDLRQRWWLPGGGELGLVLAALRQRQPVQAREFDPFTRAAFDLVAYREARASLRQPVGEHLELDLGGTVRRLEDRADEGPFNREFEHGWVATTWSVPGHEGVALSVSGDAWHGDGSRIVTLGGGATADLTATVRLEAASSYALYRADLFGAEERTHVRTWSLGLRWDVTDGWRARLVAELESDDEERYLAGKAVLTWSF